jgi:hypothetical protein
MLNLIDSQMDWLEMMILNILICSFLQFINKF